jgi:hypothetical protein
MKITEHMILQFAGEPEIGAGAAHYIEQGLTRALKDVPDVEPFTFPGYPDNEVYLHPCGTVTDVLPGPSETRACVEDGACDCEGGQPWRRIYVEKTEKVA